MILFAVRSGKLTLRPLRATAIPVTFDEFCPAMFQDFQPQLSQHTAKPRITSGFKGILTR